MKEFNFDVSIPSFKEDTYNIKDCGAKPNGKFNNAKIINNTINECSKNGGGKVIIPSGIWFTSPIQLKNDVNLHLEDGAVLFFSDKFYDYPLINTSWEGLFTYRCIPQIYCENLNNIAITGNGIIDGNGAAWRPVKQAKITKDMWNKIVNSGGFVSNEKEKIWWPSEIAYKANKEITLNPKILKDKRLCIKYKDYLRPVLINLTKCENVLIDGPTFQNSASWCLHPWLCKNLTIKNINVKNASYSQNGDGIDIDSCKYVNLYNSTFDVGDDAICIKSGKNEDGRKLGKPSEYIDIKNCRVYNGHGGFVVGSEMSGGVKNIKISDCTFMGTDTGIRFKSCAGRGGVVENIFIENINMTYISKEAIILTMLYDMDTNKGHKIKKEEIPEFKDIYIEKINCINAGTSIIISGLPQLPIHDIHLKDINIKSLKSYTIKNAKNISQENILSN